jgi:hypothetical protein
VPYLKVVLYRLARLLQNGAMKPSTLITFLVLLPILYCPLALAQKNRDAGYSADRFVEDCRAAIVDYDSPSKRDIGSGGEHCIG